MVAVEQSEFSAKALDYAVGLAKKENAELTALTVAEALAGTEEVFPDSFIEEKLMEQAKATAENARQYAKGKGVTLRVITESSASPAESILDTATKLGADLVVLGSRGKKGIARFLLGSVASKVAAHASCSVLIVR